MKITYEDDDGEKVSETIPSKREVCPDCDGTGEHLHRGLRVGFTREEFRETFDDDESREGYFSGRFDVPCETCRGRNVIEVPDVERMTEAQLRAFEAWQGEVDVMRAIDCESRSERRMMGY